MSTENILGAIGLAGLLIWVAHGLPASIERHGGAITFRYGIGLRRFALLLGFGSLLGLTIMAIIHRPRDDGEVWAIFFLYLLFGVDCLALVRVTGGFAVTVTDRGLQCRPTFRRPRFVAWDEIEVLTTSKLGRDFVLRTRRGFRFRIPAFMPELDLFLAELKKHRKDQLLE